MFGLPLIIFVFCGLLTVVQLANVTNVAQYVPQHDELCTNECSDTDPRYWCGGFKEDATGRVMRCVQYTKLGQPCVAECGGKKKYNWCLTNKFSLDEGDWWDYCSLVGFTINKEKCTDECGMNGENYFWCHTSKADPKKWDYCSPPGLVKPVQFTTKGGHCISECRQEEKNYHWCNKNLDYCGENSCDDDWEYCSLDDEHTRYNYQCEGPCTNKGTDYYWCNQGGSWEYCSPKPKIGVHFSDHIELTIYGVKCRDMCALYGKDYYFCSVYGRSHWNYWDYCSPNPKTTIKKGKCKDECASRGESYYWCNTGSSWDYCSPKFVPGMVGFGSVHAGADRVKHQIVLLTAILYFIE